jgi:glucose-6-phosphate-specific signal transduction histidine kinase
MKMFHDKRIFHFDKEYKRFLPCMLLLYTLLVMISVYCQNRALTDFLSVMSIPCFLGIAVCSYHYGFFEGFFSKK